MRHIGIAAVSAEGAALCFQTVCREAAKTHGHRNPTITLHQPPFQSVLEAQNRGDWDAVARIMIDAITTLAQAGAEFAIMPANSVHFAYDKIAERSPVPVLNIVDITTEECRARKWRKVGILGVGFTMKGRLFDASLKNRGIEPAYPSEEDQEAVNHVINEEIIPGRVTPAVVQRVVGIIERFKQPGASTPGCEGVILGCTELPIIITEENSPLPFVDTTRLLAVKALEEALRH
ncbi:MAG: putative Aspartate racemase [Candidatus Peregrinibacteria bacterium Greene0416_19]|nr:MAG: putative Aspartate racemase [Candidatus Peregrinibacteria bacterium Greene0416_19]